MGQVDLEHGEAARSFPEAESFIERNRPFVGLLGVDERLADPPTPEPVEPVDDQTGAEALSLGLGHDREALHVAACPGPPEECVSGPVRDHPEPGRRGRVDGFIEACGVETPERLERRVVDGEDAVHVSTPDPAESRTGLPGNVEQVVAEKVQTFADVEPGIEIRAPFVGRQCRRHGAHIAGRPGAGEGVAHEFGRNQCADRGGETFRRVVVTTPRTDPDAHAVGRDGVGRGHAAGAEEVAAMHGQRYVSPFWAAHWEAMPTLLYTDPRFVEHDTSPGHPERPARMGAVDRGVEASTVVEDLIVVGPRAATVDELARVHDRDFLAALERFCVAGGGRLDPDTVASKRSWDVACLAAGAGLDAVDRLRAGEADTAFLAVRPPGHHATPTRAMGFCLVNNVAVTAAALADAGERVLIVDIDAHHGNGTQDAFWNDPRVTYVSIHEYPMYPGTGPAGETGGADAPGTTVNIPVPEFAAGDTYRRAVDEIVVPIAERHAPTWLLISTGFDAHRNDPLTGLGLTSGDYHDLTQRLLALVPASRAIVFLEGGYDLDAVTTSTAATLGALSGVEIRPEAVTSTGPGGTAIDKVRLLHHL